MIGIGSCSFFDKEGNLHGDTIFSDLSIIINHDLLILDPGGLKVRERFMGARHAYLHRIVKTLWGGGYDFGYFCD
jgi:hypothetical protein